MNTQPKWLDSDLAAVCQQLVDAGDELLTAWIKDGGYHPDMELALHAAAELSITPKGGGIGGRTENYHMNVTAHLPYDKVRALAALHREMDEAADAAAQYFSGATFVVEPVNEAVRTMRQGAEIIRALLYHVPEPPDPDRNTT